MDKGNSDDHRAFALAILAAPPSSFHDDRSFLSISIRPLSQYSPAPLYVTYGFGFGALVLIVWFGPC